LALQISSFGGRPQTDAELQALIRRMSVDNPLWGAPRIHGELLKLGFEVAQSSVAKYWSSDVDHRCRSRKFNPVGFAP
jgi:hypothetical protein